MTCCIGIRVDEGLVAIADTQVTTGTERITARKVTIHQHGRHSMFIMTSGLRSLRDKTLTYFEEVLDRDDASFDKLYQAVNAFGIQVRRVASEDKASLAENGLPFNLYSIVGGQLEADREPKLYLLYPPGNWVEVSRASPYFVIGESTYGKPLLDRVLQYQTSLDRSLKLAYLAFDATRISATDVDFPLDVVVYRRDSYEMNEHRYERGDLQTVSEWWQSRLRQCVDELPDGWVQAAMKGKRTGVV